MSPAPEPNYEYEPQREMLISPNFPDPLLGSLEDLEMRTAFAADPDPGESLPKPLAPALRTSSDVPMILGAADVEAPGLVAIAMDARLRPMHVLAGPPARSEASARSALRELPGLSTVAENRPLRW